MESQPRTLGNLPPLPEDVHQWRILLLVSAVNSLTQRVATYLGDVGCERVSIELALTDEQMTSAVIAHSPHVVICPFLVKKVPEVIYSNILTLIVHPGPPGDAGPAALDWVLLGDRGVDADPAAAIQSLVKPMDRAIPLEQRQRTHWGVTVLQADNTFDGGPVWAFDQFPLPDIAHTTKSTLYQGAVTSATIRAVTVALTRISDAFRGLADPSHRASRVSVPIDPKWAIECVSYGAPFKGGPLHDRPQIKPGQRRPVLNLHTAADVARIINCGDSQPGGTLKTARSFIFAYDAKLHLRVQDLPADLISESGHSTWEDIPAGEALATRDGAVLFKTAPCTHGSTCSHGCGVAVWITHGRLPKAVTSQALPAKVCMADALRLAGEGERLERVPEWIENDFTEVPGTYQQVFIRSVAEGDAIIQFVYWDFYNGAFSTTGCEHLIRALQWAADPARGNVKVLALMGGGYFSNGVALNIIESADHPGRETWANINAIDDVVEFLSGDMSSAPRSDFLAGVASLTERGITTVACMRGNAAAGGVALAAACDVVVSTGTVVLNPAYRAMGLHGSEFHLYSYVKRCGRPTATHLVKDMLPLSASRARDVGLVDAVVDDRDTAATEAQTLLIDFVRNLVRAPAGALNADLHPSAPWTTPVGSVASDSYATSLVDRMCENKRKRYTSSSHIPLVHYRHEELSQMLLDSFHPVRGQRYHTRRIKFVRKVKAVSTPTRFCKHRIHAQPDEEELASFDDAPGWVRGEEWSWVGLQTPSSMATSSGLLIDFATPVPPLMKRFDSGSYTSSQSTEIHTDEGGEEAAMGTPVTQTTDDYLSPLDTPTTSALKTPVILLTEPTQGKKDSPSSFRGFGSIRGGYLSADSLVNSKPKKSRRASIIGKLVGVFRSRHDLTTSSMSPSGLQAPSRVASTPSLRPSYAYQRPIIPNEGDTESPCLFNVTEEHPSISVRSTPANDFRHLQASA